MLPFCYAVSVAPCVHCVSWNPVSMALGAMSAGGYAATLLMDFGLYLARHVWLRPRCYWLNVKPMSWCPEALWLPRSDTDRHYSSILLKYTINGAFIVYFNVYFIILKQINCALVGLIKDWILPFHLPEHISRGSVLSDHCQAQNTLLTKSWQSDVQHKHITRILWNQKVHCRVLWYYIGGRGWGWGMAK